MRWVIVNAQALLTNDSVATPTPVTDAEALNAVAKLTRAGIHIVLMSNNDEQGMRPDPAELCQLHSRINEDLMPLGGRIEASLFCPHGDDEDCDCRAPRPGLLKSLGRRLEISLAETPVASPRQADIEAAIAVDAPAVRLLGKTDSQEQDIEDSTTLSQWVDTYLARDAT